MLVISEKITNFAPASLVRPAPAELPQDRKVARVGGRSGAISGSLFSCTGCKDKVKSINLSSTKMRKQFPVSTIRFILTFCHHSQNTLFLTHSPFTYPVISDTAVFTIEKTKESIYDIP